MLCPWVLCRSVVRWPSRHSHFECATLCRTQDCTTTRRRLRRAVSACSLSAGCLRPRKMMAARQKEKLDSNDSPNSWSIWHAISSKGIRPSSRVAATPFSLNAPCSASVSTEIRTSWTASMYTALDDDCSKATASQNSCTR